MWNAFLIAFVIVAATADVAWGRIPRNLMVVGFFGGLAYHAIHGGVISALVAALLGFAGGMLLFQMGAIGGGDVKLVVALGALLGLQQWVAAMYVAILAAGIMAAVQIIRHRAFRQTWTNVKAILSGIRRQGLQAHPYFNVRNTALLRSPFGLAAAVGTLVAVLR